MTQNFPSDQCMTAAGCTCCSESGPHGFCNGFKMAEMISFFANCKPNLIIRFLGGFGFESARMKIRTDSNPPDSVFYIAHP